MNRPPLELVCPAGALPSLKAAIDNGTDWVYVGLRDDTNARNFSGLNFDAASLAEGTAYAHRHGRKVVVAVNTYPQAASWERWTAAIDRRAASRPPGFVPRQTRAFASRRTTWARCGCSRGAAAGSPARTSTSTTPLRSR